MSASIKDSAVSFLQVAVHSRVRMNRDHPGVAVVHIFRFEDDRIAELWDIGQPAPESSPNSPGMF